VVAQKDINLIELAELLRAERGASFGPAPSGAASIATA